MKIVVTAGGTREYIDPVRYISNASTGKMGYEIAKAAVAAGHDVTLISAPTSLTPPSSVKIINVITSEDMFEAVRANYTDCDCLIMSAAVSDYKPSEKSSIKIKKQKQELILQLVPTTDILNWAGENKNAQILVGFALEDRDLHKNAHEKMQKKHLDMIVANSPAAIASEMSKVYIKTLQSDWLEFEEDAKSVTARKIIDLLETL